MGNSESIAHGQQLSLETRQQSNRRAFNQKDFWKPPSKMTNPENMLMNISDDSDDAETEFWAEDDPAPEEKFKPFRNECHWRKIPPEIWTLIFQELDEESLLNASVACKEWNEMYRNDSQFTSIICLNPQFYLPLKEPFTFETKDKTFMDFPKINSLISGFPKLRRLYIDLTREGNEIEDIHEFPIRLDTTGCPELDFVDLECATRPENPLWNPENADGRFRTVRDLLITVAFNPQEKKDALTSLDITEFAIDGLRAQQTEVLEFLKINKFKKLRFLDLQGMWFTSKRCMNYMLDAAINDDVKQHLKLCYVCCWRAKEDTVEEMLNQRFTPEEFPIYQRTAVQGYKRPRLETNHSGDEYYTDTSEDEDYYTM